MLGELPFYPLFSDLRRQTGLSLTPAHLADLQRLILEMYPQSPEEVLALCRMIWLQKAEVSETFNNLFWQHWSQLEATFNNTKIDAEQFTEERSKDEVENSNKVTSDPLEDKPENKNQDKEEKNTSYKSSLSDSGREQIADDVGKKNRNIWLQFGEYAGDDHQQNGNSNGTRYDFLDHSFIYSPKYWPLPGRRLQQIWRYLRNERQKTIGVDIDIGATVKKIATEKLIDKPVYELKFPLKAQDIHVLLDISASMTPYTDLSYYFVESLFEALKPRQNELFYFKNYLQEKLYRDPGLFEGYTTQKWLRSLHKYSLVVIISDAGASRNDTQPEQVSRTRKFLKDVNLQTNRVLWLNPLPEVRWIGNSAFYIALFVTMVGAEHTGLQRLPDILKKW